MATHPFTRRRAAHRFPQGTTWHLPPPILLRLPTFAMIAMTLILVTTGCGPSRPIPPSRTTSTPPSRSADFNAGQIARLDRLRALLDEPAPAELSSGLLVRLAFDDVADLDLFVTDPLQESVYFANSPTRTGGRLVRDRRCKDPSPRVEAVHFQQPIAGRYRVGVDFHQRCPDSSAIGADQNQGLYLVRVEEGGRVLERRGMLTPGFFEVIVIEFDVHSVEPGTSQRPDRPTRTPYTSP